MGDTLNYRMQENRKVTIIVAGAAGSGKSCVIDVLKDALQKLNAKVTVKDAEPTERSLGQSQSIITNQGIEVEIVGVQLNRSNKDITGADLFDRLKQQSRA